MNSEKKMWVAFLLNAVFAAAEAIGGLWTGSIAIVSDAVHDMGDAIGIGVACFLERKSKQAPDKRYTYGYGRYSVVGGLLTVLILLGGSVAVIVTAVQKLLNPTDIRYDEMIVFAVVGAAVNLIAAVVTRDGDSINQKALNLHMLEDVLGWLVVLVGAVVMRFTDWKFIDPLMSIGVAVFILAHAVRHLKETLAVFCETVPTDVDVDELCHHLTKIDGVHDVHHLHVWSIDGNEHCATAHIVTDADGHTVKEAVRAELLKHGIAHVTLELEAVGEHCHARECTPAPCAHHGHHHHHH